MLPAKVGFAVGMSMLWGSEQALVSVHILLHKET